MTDKNIKIIPLFVTMPCAVHDFGQRIFSNLDAQILANAKELLSKNKIVGLLVS
jgi:hypothetical protein